MTRIICNILDAKEAGYQITFSDACLHRLSHRMNGFPLTVEVGRIESARVVDGALEIVADVSHDFAAALESGDAVIAPDVMLTSDDIVDNVIVRCILRSASIVPIRGREVEATP